MSLESPRKFNREHPWEAAAFLVWIVISMAIQVRAGLQPHRANAYLFFRDAGLNWRAGNDLYQDVGSTCRYSPLVHAFLVPFASLPVRPGGMLWRLLNQAAFLGTLYWWGRTLLPRTSSDRARGLVILGTIPLAIGSLDNGQSNPLMLAGMLVAVTAAFRERWNLAALGLALAFFLKIYPIALVLLLLLVYPRQLSLRFVGFIAAGLLLPFALQEPGYVARQYANWWTSLEVDDRSQIALHRAYRDLWLLVRIWHLPISQEVYRVIQLGGAVLAAALVPIMRARHVDRATLLNLALGLAACWMMLLGPATESSTYIVLAPTLAWALADAWGGPRSNWLRGAAAASFGLFVLARLAGAFPSAADLHGYGPHPVGALFLTVYLVSTCVRVAAGRGIAKSESMKPTGQAA